MTSKQQEKYDKILDKQFDNYDAIEANQDAIRLRALKRLLRKSGISFTNRQLDRLVVDSTCIRLCSLRCSISP